MGRSSRSFRPNALSGRLMVWKLRGASNLEVGRWGRMPGKCVNEGERGGCTEVATRRTLHFPLVAYGKYAKHLYKYGPDKHGHGSRSFRPNPLSRRLMVWKLRGTSKLGVDKWDRMHGKRVNEGKRGGCTEVATRRTLHFPLEAYDKYAKHL